MKNNINYAALSVNDIIFLGRNKEYGAYELRESYEQRIKQSLGGALFFIAFACCYQLVYSAHHPTPRLTEPQVKAKVTEVTIPEREAIQPPQHHTNPPKPQGKPGPTAAGAAMAVLVPAKAGHAIDSMPAADQPATAVALTGAGVPEANTGSPAGDLTFTVSKPAAPAVAETKEWVEVMPEYPGGEREMMKFLAENIYYPDPDRSMGIQGRVVVGFVIDENGRVTNISIVKGLTNSLNQESMRVVSKLSDFKPGMQGGRTVRVRYKLPINYTLRDE